MSEPVTNELTRESALSFRDQLREARAAALRDAEGFIGICRCLERLAYFRTGRGDGFGRAQPAVEEVASRSPLAHEIPSRWPEFHPELRRLYDSVREARNQAVHEGAYARNITRQAVELSLVVEDALQEYAMSPKNPAMQVRDFMVRDPVVAELWEPVSFVRQKMLVNSFSFLPVRNDSGEWRLISDRSLARYLRTAGAENRQVRNARLAKRLRDAIGDRVELEDADTCGCDDPISEVAARICHRPFLVVSRDKPDRLLGIVTAFDLM